MAAELKGEILRTKILNIFKNAGFTTTKEHPVNVDGKIKPIDILATHNNISIMVSCTGEKDITFSEFVHDNLAVAQKAKVNKLLLVRTISEVDQENRDFATKKDISIWTEKEIAYFESVVDAIGEYGKYDIISFLGLKTKEEEPVLQILALKLNQPLKDSNNEIYLFVLSPESLLKTAVVFRRAIGEATTYQRLLNKKRLPGIAKYLKKSDIIFPVDIIASLGDKIESVKVDDASFKCVNNSPFHCSTKNVEVHLLKIPLEYGAIEIIDGQHRLFGFSRVADNNIKNNFNLIIAGIKNINAQQKKDVFVAINSKSRRMDANLVAYLEYAEDEAICQNNNKLMALKIAVKLNSSEPFKNKIRLLDIGEEPVTLKGISGYSLKQLVSKNGLLKRYYGNDSEEYVRAIRMYFNMLKSVVGADKWRDHENYRLLSNRSMSAFIMLINSLLKTIGRKYTTSDLTKYFGPLKSFNFTKAEFEGKYVGSGGWKRLHRALVKKIKSRYNEFKR